MKITFVMPCYPWSPMGGFKVVYEYANRLTRFGHQVTVVHAREVRFGPQHSKSFFDRLREFRDRVSAGDAIPSINWQKIDAGVKLLFVPDTDACHIPDGDAVFATAWNTVAAVLHYPDSKGAKFYLIQHYELFLGPKKLVDETWRAPLTKIVISKWLVSVGKDLGISDLTYIPNAVDHQRYRVMSPIGSRPKRVAMLFSHVPFKGARDGIAAIEFAKRKHPDLQAVFFGTGRHAGWIPDWIRYHRDPPQELITKEIYNLSSIFLSPSWAEGFALPPAEAACCGCAIVASDSGGIADFIDHERTGLLSQPRDWKALGDNLCRLLDDRSLRIGLAEAAGKRLSGFTWERSALLLESLIASKQFASLASGNRSASVI